MYVRFFLIIFLLILTSCSNVKRSAEQQESNNYVIFIPGYKGTKLVDEQNNLIWLNASEALFGKNSLAIPDEGLKIRNSILKKSALLEEIKVIPFIYHYSIYNLWVEQLEKIFVNHKVIEFPYDWRQDNYLTVKSLDQTIKKLKENGANSITLVAHSMGGLVASYYLRYGSQDYHGDLTDTWDGAKNINKVIILGSPFLGALTIFHDLQFGNKTVFNTTLLDTKSLGTFSSAYQLLPYSSKNIIKSKNKINLFDINTWQKNNWGLFKVSNSEKIIIRKYLQEKLSDANKFLSAIHKDSSSKIKTDTKLINIVGHNRTTDNLFNFNEKELKVLFNSRVTTNGDGLITVDSAELPLAYKEHFNEITIFTEKSHGDLILDNNNINLIKEYFRQLSR